MESLVAIAAVVGVVWGAVVFLRGGLLAGALAVLLAGICFGHSAFHVEAGPIPLTSDRVLWVLLMVQLLYWWRHGLTESRRIGRPEILLLAFVGVLGVNVLTHDWSYNGNQPASQLVFYYLMPLGIYWVGWQARISERGLKTMFVLMGIFGVYLAITAIAERFELTALILPPYIVTSEFREFLGRARGPLLNPAANGMLLGSCLGAGLMIWPRAPRWGQLLLIGYAVLMCLGIYCTMTRSAWMGGCLGLLILLFLVLPRYYRPWLLASVVLGSVIVVATQWANIVEFKRDKNLTSRETASSAELRGTLAAIAWEMFCDRPLLGCGLGHYLDEHGNYLTNRNIDIPLEQGRNYVQHNVWLSLLTETGLLGMTLFTLVIIAWLSGAWRLWTASGAPPWMRQQGLFFLIVTANYVPNAMFQDMSIIPMVNMILFFLAGVTINLQLCAAEFTSQTAAVSIRQE